MKTLGGVALSLPQVLIEGCALARTTCTHCANHSFELSELTPTSSNFIYQAVQCSGCGVLVAVLDSSNLESMLQRIEKRLTAIEQRLSR